MPLTYYDLLEVAQQATTYEIKDKYRAAVRKCHPDVAVDKAQATRQFVQISRAYRTLRDAELRQRYDQSLQSGGTIPPPSAPSEPVNIPQLLQQAERAFFQGKMLEAHALCAKVLRQDGRHARALALLGDILVGLNKPEEAAVAFRLSSHVEPSAMVQAKLARLTQARAVAATIVPAANMAPVSIGSGNTEETKPISLLKRLFHRT